MLPAGNLVLNLSGILFRFLRFGRWARGPVSTSLFGRLASQFLIWTNLLPFSLVGAYIFFPFLPLRLRLRWPAGLPPLQAQLWERCSLLLFWFASWHAAGRFGCPLGPALRRFRFQVGLLGFHLLLATAVGRATSCVDISWPPPFIFRSSSPSMSHFFLIVSHHATQAGV